MTYREILEQLRNSDISATRERNAITAAELRIGALWSAVEKLLAEKIKVDTAKAKS